MELVWHQPKTSFIVCWSELVIVGTSGADTSKVASSANKLPVTSGCEICKGTWKDDLNNTANKDGNFMFQPVNVQVKYKSKPVELRTSYFYTFARSIALSSWTKEYPYDTVNSAFRGEGSVARLESTGVYKFWLAVGVLLALICLLSAVCCCCYCLCGHCSPKVEVPRTKMILMTCCGLIFKLTIIGSVGAVMIWRGNDDTNKVAHQAFDTAGALFSDTEIFVNSFYDEIMAVFRKLDFAEAIVCRDLENIGPLMGDMIRNALLTDTGLGDIFQGFRNLHQAAKDGVTSIDQLVAALTDLNTAIANLNAHFQRCPQNLTDKCSAATVPIVSPSFTPLRNAMQANAEKNVSKMIDKAAKELTDAPEEIRQTAPNTSQKVEESLTNSLEMVRKFKTVAEDFKKNILSKLEVEKTKKKISDIRERWLPVELLRFAFLRLLGLLEFIVVALLLVGAVVGLLADQDVAKAVAERMRRIRPGATVSRKVAKCAAFIIKIGLVLFKAPSCLLMTLAVVFFVFFSPVEKLLCSPVVDPSFEILDTLVEDYLFKGNGTFLSRALDTKVNVTFGGILKSCQNDSPAFKAFGMESSSIINLTERLDFKESLNLNKRINESIPSINEFKFLDDPDIDLFIKTFEDLEQVQPSDLDTTLDQTTQATDRAKKDIPHPPVQEAIGEVNRNLEIVKGKKAVYDRLFGAEGSASPATARKLRADASEVDKKIPAAITPAINKGVEMFVGRVTKSVDALINTTKDDIYNRTGKCGIVYNMFKMVFIETICTNFINALNGLWLALGWWNCVMLFTCIPCVKLIRYLRSPSPLE